MSDQEILKGRSFVELCDSSVKRKNEFESKNGKVRGKSTKEVKCIFVCDRHTIFTRNTFGVMHIIKFLRTEAMHTARTDQDKVVQQTTFIYLL